MICTHILIDGSNLAYRAESGYGSDGSYKTGAGKSNSLVYGFMSMLANVRNMAVGVIPVIAWEGGYDHRTELSRRGVELGIIPGEYKGNRGEPDPIRQSIHDQMPDLRAILATTDIPQIRVSGYEADDVIASYIRKICSDGGKAMALTVDKDYFATISKNSMVCRKDEIFGYYAFVEKYGIEPEQWTDVGALSGDTGDNIYGVPGCGEKTAISLIKDHGDYESVIAACASELSPLRAEYPDLDNQDDVNELISFGAGKKSNKYEGCYVGMPFSGVALAIERKKIRKVKVITLMIAMYQQRVRLAYRLKKMVDDIELPELKVFNRFDENEFEAICSRFEVTRLMELKRAFSCEDVRRS
jgi:5'-3' exonuclease